MTADEPPLEPDREIIDPHLHLWHIQATPGAPQAPQRFLLPEFLDTLKDSGQRITHTVFVECHAMHRHEGPPELRPLGEVEFVNGIAAMSASGGYGSCRVAHRIVGSADLRLGAHVTPVLERMVAAAGERFRGVRFNTAFSKAGLFGWPCDPELRGRLRDPGFREGARVLARMDLSLDVWCMHTQLRDLAGLADAAPDLVIVLDHLGTPESLGAYAGQAAEARAEWSTEIHELARRPNVRVKLGGLGMDVSGPIAADVGRTSSEVMAAAWRPYVETCIAAFTTERCMFESNYPPDKAAGRYGALWNAWKRIAAGCSDDEKDALFRRTAAATYRIALD